MCNTPQPDNLLAALLEAHERRTPCVLVTVVGFEGSTPRKPGAKMLVYADRRPVGTVGGGALEKHLIERAQELMGQSQPVLLERIPLAPLGMQCGGSVTVLMEPQTMPSQLYLFGAGHVAEPLAKMAAMADFDVSVLDERPDLLTEERFGSSRRLILGDPVKSVEQLSFERENTYAVVVTHSHALDAAIALEILRKPFKYLGVIGSIKKRDSFRQGLVAQGIAPEQVARLHMPVGIPILAESPSEIAVSILAQLIETRRTPVANATASV